ncbi:uncharacterized protein EI90DRAFT_3281650 [Cantharellus anzutake]|uniref:uncharacterized protein n=1 Tax=Cantharellus anzutake TaxID=1750568 RepID=UPI0019036376|nr:uncharacterized protein EI90DRAFT_3281650 [Cantharellus anzutake]KAF8326608.1 hypothetical protein EI90DRAFT_3281650 [Cantharellus anzutake]
MSQAASLSRDATDSPSPAPSAGPVNRHAPTPLERQRMQLDKLFKEPSKPAYIPPPPKEKTIRPPREMIKNVQGSSAGAGSGEFHVYKQNRRREYERIKLMEEKTQKEMEAAEFEIRKRERDEAVEAKTAKNRAKRQKKKAARTAAKKEGQGSPDEGPAGQGTKGTVLNENGAEPVFKKRRLIGGDGQAITFRVPGQEDHDGGDDNEGLEPSDGEGPNYHGSVPSPSSAKVIETGTITIVDED